MKSCSSQSSTNYEEPCTKAKHHGKLGKAQRRAGVVRELEVCARG